MPTVQGWVSMSHYTGSTFIGTPPLNPIISYSTPPNGDMFATGNIPIDKE